MFVGICGAKSLIVELSKVINWKLEVIIVEASVCVIFIISPLSLKDISIVKLSISGGNNPFSFNLLTSNSKDAMDVPFPLFAMVPLLKYEINEVTDGPMRLIKLFSSSAVITVTANNLDGKKAT